MESKARVWERTHSPFTYPFHTWRGLQGQRYHLPNPLCVCDSEGTINKGRYGGQADEARDILFSSTGRHLQESWFVCQEPGTSLCTMGGLKSKPRILSTFFNWLSNNSIHPIYMIDQWQFNTYTVTAIYNALHAEILHLFLGDWLQLTVLLLKALLPAIFKQRKSLISSLFLNDTIVTLNK